MNAAANELEPCIGCRQRSGHSSVESVAAILSALHGTAKRELCSMCHARQVVRVERAGIPDRFRHAHRANPKFRTWVRDVAATEAAHVWLPYDWEIDRLVLVGSTGVGKTTLACSLLHEYFAQSFEGDCRFVDSYALALARRNTQLGTEAEIVRHALEADLLVIDDLGAEARDFSDTINFVIHRRHAGTDRTIVTTFLTADEIAARYGAGVARRLLEDARVIEVKERT